MVKTRKKNLKPPMTSLNHVWNVISTFFDVFIQNFDVFTQNLDVFAQNPDVFWSFAFSQPWSLNDKTQNLDLFWCFCLEKEHKSYHRRPRGTRETPINGPLRREGHISVRQCQHLRLWQDLLNMLMIAENDHPYLRHINAPCKRSILEVKSVRPKSVVKNDHFLRHKHHVNDRF